MIFSAGKDGTLKAWGIDRQGAKFNPIDVKNLQSPVLCLQMLPNNIIVAGLENGSMSVWNLDANTVNSMPAH